MMSPTTHTAYQHGTSTNGFIISYNLTKTLDFYLKLKHRNILEIKPGNKRYKYKT